MEATVQRKDFLSQPHGIILVILASVIIWRFAPMNLTTLVLIAVSILFLFGLRRPLWAMAALLVSQLTLTSYMVNTPFGIIISLRLLLLILMALSMWFLHAQEKIELGIKAKNVIIPAVFLIGLSFISNLSNTGLDYAFKDFRNMLVGILIIIFLPAVVRNMKDLKILCGVVFIGMTASAIIGVLQYYGILGMDYFTLTSDFVDSWGGQPRVSGIAETELELSFTLPVVTLATLGIVLAKGVSIKNRRILGISVVIMVIALYYTFTRSALLGIILGMIAFILFLVTKKVRAEFILFGAIIALILIEQFGIAGDTYMGGRSQASQEESSLSRPILWQASFGIIKDNPILGIGAAQFSEVSAQYESSVDPSLIQWEEDRYWGYRTLGNQKPHNDFLAIWVYYGTFALIAFLWLLSAILRNLVDSYRASKKRFIKGLCIGLAAGFITYLANAFYHNCLTAMPLLWIIAGFSVAAAKLTLKTKEQKQPRYAPAEALRKENR